MMSLEQHGDGARGMVCIYEGYHVFVCCIGLRYPSPTLLILGIRYDNGSSQCSSTSSPELLCGTERANEIYINIDEGDPCGQCAGHVPASLHPRPGSSVVVVSKNNRQR
jgi:hypothetical protein